MLACSAMVACTNDDLLENNEPQNGKVNESYLAVNLKSAHTASRAADGTYEDGTDTENAASKVLFFFFDASDNAYVVDADNNVNYLEKDITLNANTPANDNVEEISNEILVISKSKSVPPQKILAVLNAPEALKQTSNLEDLQDLVGEYNKVGDKFVMTNSVYKHAATGDVVIATELAAENICASQEDALENPIDIYVERVAAKVRVTAAYGEGNTSFATGITTTDNKAIYAKVQGWKVTNIKNEAYLLKNISEDWTNEELGFVWNDAPYFRSYWANTTAAGWKNPKHPWKWSELTNSAAAGVDYYYENTDANVDEVKNADGEVTTPAEHNKSQLLVAADFVDVNGSPIVIAEWYGQKYTLEDLKIAIANAVKSQIFIKNSDGTATSITDSDIDFFQEKQDAADNRYLSYAKLVTASEGKSFVGPDGTTVLPKETVNTMLKSVRPAKIWKEGGYYYMDIKHLATTAGKVGEFGLVRNHLYDITIDGITGLGTPVYDPEKVITPEKPESDESFIAARINVLAWRVVSQSVTLQ